MYGVVVVVVAVGIICDTLDGSGLSTLGWSRCVDVYHFVWSGCDYFQCDREIRFMCAGGKGGAKIDGGLWNYVGSRVYCILVRRICVYMNVRMMMCVCILVCLCACICPHMYVV